MGIQHSIEGALVVTDVKRGTTGSNQKTKRHDACISPLHSASAASTRQGMEKDNLEEPYHLRPDVFASTLQEVAFVMSISLVQILDEYLMSGFLAMLPALMREFSLTSEMLTWPCSAPALVISAFLLTFGRLADIYGGFLVYIGGAAWAIIWTLIAGFSTGVPMLILCRAMQGLGASAYLPAGLTMLGRLYRPGPRKNLVFSIYGAMAPVGFFIGILAAGLVSRYAHWLWYFRIGAMIGSVGSVGACLTAPRSFRVAHDIRNLRMDWMGSLGIATTLTLFVFAITEAADAPQGWRTPYVLATAISALVGLAATVVIEVRIVKHPLLPASVFQIRHFLPLCLGLLLSYGTVGLYVCYATL